MKRFSFLIGIVPLGLILLTNCSNSSSGPDLARVEVGKGGEDEKIYIVDRTGKKWDVTHAKEKYGMEPGKFQFGLGPNAIRPILNAKMLSPGDEGYPDSGRQFLVLGTTLNGSTRAYPITIMSSFEIADEQFGDAHVAVAY
ncbi:MAG: hypothetical protein V3U73_02100 [bacterium]